MSRKRKPLLSEKIHEERVLLRMSRLQRIKRRNVSEEEAERDILLNRLTGWQRHRWEKAGRPQDILSIDRFLRMRMPGSEDGQDRHTVAVLDENDDTLAIVTPGRARP